MRSGVLAVALLVAVAAAGVARVQPRLRATVHAVKQREDVFLLPPRELRALTLGHTAAAADALWASLLVEYGTHLQEKRPFDDAARYLDGILALEPDFELVYAYADTLLLYHAPVGTEADWYKAREFLERGLRERPRDAKVWLHYGQFMAFMTASFVKDRSTWDGFRRTGASAIAHAVELGADPDRSITAATLLTRYGERDAAIRQLRNAYALTDDPADRDQIASKLAVLEAGAEREAAARTVAAIEARWRSDVPFLKRDMYLLLAPLVDPLACAGARRGRPECAREWDAVLGQDGQYDR